MNSEMLNDGDFSESEIPKSYEQIYTNSKYLAGMIQRMLLSAKIDADEITIDWVVLELNPLVQEIIQQVKNDFSSGLNIIYNPNHEIKLKTDKNLLKIILSELIKNSIIFNEAETKVTIAAGDINGKISISVKDNGKGIPKESLQKVREKFVRLDSSLTYKVSGTGLGLYIADQLVKKLGGNMQISNPDDGGLMVNIILGS